MPPRTETFETKRQTTETLLCPHKNTRLSFVRFDKVVASESLPESLEERRVVANVLVAEHGLNSTSSLFGVVERNTTLVCVSFSL
jgi:hypothetical protein